MRDKLRVGFVGTGGIARGQHIPAWMARTDAEVVAICDIDPDAAAQGAKLTEVDKDRVYEDYDKMLEEEDLDVVDVCTPNCVHMPPTVAALEAGCHVFVEKPVATSADEVRKMIAARDRSKKLLCVTQNMRFSDEAIAAKRFVDEGGIGDPYWAKAEYLRARGVPAAEIAERSAAAMRRAKTVSRPPTQKRPALNTKGRMRLTSDICPAIQPKGDVSTKTRV